MARDVELEAIQVLRGLSSDRARSVREAAAQGLARYVHVPEALVILRVLSSDRATEVRETAARALGGRI